MLNINQIVWKRLRSVPDDRGCLTAIEASQDIPFEIKRVFYMHDVVDGADRGGHAHRETEQIAVAVHGSVCIRISDGRECRTVLLDHPGWGIYLPAMCWTTLTDFRDGAVCLVLASTHYDRSRSIRTWSEYLAERGIVERPEFDSGQMIPRPDA